MTAPDALHPFPQIDTSTFQRIVCVGRKHSGKSYAARVIFDSWPGVDRYVLDVNGDITPGDDWQTVTGEPPKKLPPRREKDQPVTVRYVPNPRSPTFRDDVDRALAPALFPRDRRVLLWVDEAGVVYPVGQTGPNGRTLNHQQRHYGIHEIDCMPRPKGVDPLVLAQADRVLIFDLPNPDDVARVADVIGAPRTDLIDALREIRAAGRHWYVMYVLAEHEMYLCPPIPKEWARG